MLQQIIAFSCQSVAILCIYLKYFHKNFLLKAKCLFDYLVKNRESLIQYKQICSSIEQVDAEYTKHGFKESTTKKKRNLN